MNAKKIARLALVSFFMYVHSLHWVDGLPGLVAAGLADWSVLDQVLW